MMLNLSQFGPVMPTLPMWRRIWKFHNDSCNCFPRNNTNPLESRGNYSATSDNMKLIHWPLKRGLLHLVQRGGDWPPQPAQAPHRCTVPNVTAHPSTASCVPITVWSVALRNFQRGHRLNTGTNERRNTWDQTQNLPAIAEARQKYVSWIPNRKRMGLFCAVAVVT